jgi:predicted anti-sigma-YlaC factor YlaD
MTAWPRFAALVLALSLSGACSLKKLAVGGLAGALEGSATAYAREDDPELVREALPFALKTIEAVLIEDPENESLLASAGTSFGLYAALLELEAEEHEEVDYAGAEREKARARALYLRARDFALRALELGHPGIRERLAREPVQAAAALEKGDVPLAYLAAGTWGTAIALGKDDPALVADVDAVRALFRRALELDEGYDEGALHEAMISVEGLPRAMGGSPERAREHFRRSLELSGGRRASLYLSLAENVSVSAQDRAEFERLVGQALAVDLAAAPDLRLSNRIAQERARRLLDGIDDLFLPPLE